MPGRQISKQPKVGAALFFNGLKATGLCQGRMGIVVYAWEWLGMWTPGAEDLRGKVDTMDGICA